MYLNRIISVSFQDAASPADGDAYYGGITVAEIKRWLKETFGDSEQWEIDENTDLQGLLAGARKAAENYTGLSIAEKTVTVYYWIHETELKLPYGRPSGTVTVSSWENQAWEALTDLEDYELMDDMLTFFTTGKKYKISFPAGYDDGADVPEDIKMAIKNEVAFRYRNKGDQEKQYATENVALCESSRNILDPYRTVVI